MFMQTLFKNKIWVMRKLFETFSTQNLLRYLPPTRPKTPCGIKALPDVMSVALAIWSRHVGGDAEPNLNLSFVYTRSHLAVWRRYRSTRQETTTKPEKSPMSDWFLVPVKTMLHTVEAKLINLKST